MSRAGPDISKTGSDSRKRAWGVARRRVCDRQRANGGPHGLADAGGGQLHPEEVDDVDEAQRGLEGAAGAVHEELDGVVSRCVEGHELSRQLPGEGIVEPPPQEDHALVEQAVPYRSVGVVGPVHRRTGCGAGRGAHRPRSPSRQSSSMPTAAA